MAKRNLDSAIEEIKAEDQPNTPPNPDPNPNPDSTPNDDTPPAGDGDGDTPPSEETTSTEDTTSTDTPPQTPPSESPAAHAYRRQLEKQEQRHKQELADLDAKWQKRFDEMKQGLPQPPAPEQKTRADFPDDDSYIQYLAEQRVNAILAERDKRTAEEKAKADEATKAQQAADAELQQRRTAWQNTVNETFGKDTARRDAFMKRVAYCNERGLGQVLEDSPVAANYLMGSVTGVKVLEKLLSDVDTMRKVFNNRTAVDPFELFWQLKQVETEVLAAERAAQGATPPSAAPAPAAPAAPTPTLPHGKPGKQAAGNQTPDIFSDNRAMLAYLRSH